MFLCTDIFFTCAPVSLCSTAHINIPPHSQSSLHSSLLSPLPVCPPYQRSLSALGQWRGRALWFQLEFKLLELCVYSQVCDVCVFTHISALLPPKPCRCVIRYWRLSVSVTWRVVARSTSQLQVFTCLIRALINTYTDTQSDRYVLPLCKNSMSQQERTLFIQPLLRVCVWVWMNPPH